MATYNALALAGYRVYFFKLALEFEYNATTYIPIISGFVPGGSFGSDAYETRDCLEADNVSSYSVYETNDSSSVDPICTFNRFSGDTTADIFSSIKNTLNKTNGHFVMG